MKLKTGQKVVFLGDSITRGFFGSNYINELKRLFSKSPIGLNYVFINTGRDGDTVGDLLHRVESDVLRHHPDWVVIMVGLNDVFYESMYMAKLSMEGPERKTSAYSHMLHHFRDNYLQLIDILKSKVENIVLCTTTIIEEDMSITMQERLALLNDAIRSLSYDKKCKLIDLYMTFKETQVELNEQGYKGALALTIDGVHLNHRGAELVAKKMFEFFADD